MIGAGERIGRIRIEGQVGEGGMGEVYRGWDEVLQRTVAVKTLRAHQRLGDDARARFLREARLLSKLDHPGICRVYDLVSGDEADYLVLEYIEGRTLRVAAREGLPEDELLRVAEAIARALAVAHREHIVHRDLKPDNVMITTGGEVKVLDFGIARSLVVEGPSRPGGGGIVSGPGDDDEGSESTSQAARADGGWTAEIDQGRSLPAYTVRTRDGEVLGTLQSMSPEQALGEPVTAGWTAEIDQGGSLLAYTVRTRDGQLLGTLQYMSPEQALGEPVTEASDIYSLGVMLQELATGRPAYEPGPLPNLIAQVARAEVASATGIDPDLAALLGQLVRRDPGERPSAWEVADRLAWIAGKPQRTRARRVRVGAAAVVATALLATLGYAVHGRWQARRQAEIVRQFAEQTRDIEWLLRAEHLSPAHDIRPAVAEVARSDTAVQIGLCRAEVTLAREQLFSQEVPLAPAALEASLALCEAAIRLDPDAAQAHSEKAAMLVLLARAQQRAGTDPSDTYGRAVASVDRALALNPNMSLAWRTRGEAELVAARWLERSGGDAEPRLRAAGEALARAIERNPGEAESYRAVAELHLWRGRWTSGRGRSPEGDIAAGLDAAGSALAINPVLAEAEALRAELYLLRAQVAGDDGAAVEARRHVLGVPVVQHSGEAPRAVAFRREHWSRCSGISARESGGWSWSVNLAGSIRKHRPGRTSAPGCYWRPTGIQSRQASQIGGAHDILATARSKEQAFGID